MAAETAHVTVSPRIEAHVVVGRVLRRFTADEYERMGELGILDEDERIELVDGKIITMAAVNVQHANCVGRLNKLLNRLAPEHVAIRVQDPVRLNDNCMPQPDFLVIPGREYTTLPRAADVLLLIEVSDSSLAYNRGEKLRMYAAAGIAEYWVADVNGQTVERFAELRDGVYKRYDLAQRGDTLASLAVPEIIVSVAGIWK